MSPAPVVAAPAEAPAAKPWKVPESVLVVIHTPDLQVLLMNRADAPGHWQSVTGSKDWPGEPLHDTAVREVAEETGLHVALDGFMGFERIANPDKPGVLVYFGGHPVGGQLQAQDDVSEARWFAPAAIPWSDLAFSSTRTILEHWVNGSDTSPEREPHHV